MLAADVIDRIATEPGVYLFKDARGAVIYVGKAKNLRARVRQYFRDGGDERFFVAAGFLSKAVADVETIVVTSSKEALLLENHLIKKHQPRFNVKLRDDKQYLVLRLVDPEPPAPDDDAPRSEVFPRVEVVRNIRDDSAHYFGPYHSATSARETLRTLNRHFQLRTCTDHVLESRGRPCLQYQIKRCSGPCAFAGLAAAYAEQVEDVKMFLSGKSAELVTRLRTRMDARAEREDFEVAAVLRDSIAAVERTLAKQHIVQDEFVDQDVWGMHREADVAEVVVLFVRGGKLVGRRAFQQKDQELPDPMVIAEHLQQYYATGTFIPDEVVVGVELEDAEVLCDWLSSLRGRRVKLVEPRRGTRARLIELADRNAAASAASRRGKDADADALLDKVARRLSLPRPPRRIECFDIAHIQGSEPVAAMVTFVDGVPARNLYRKFKVRSVDNNDFAAMYEVLTRRFKRRGDPGDPDDAWAPPDLLVIDGGKGQLGMAVAALTDLGVPLGGDTGLEVIGLAKERELEAGSAPDRIYRRTVKDSIPLRQNSPELFVLARIRDEAHRFANTFHRDRRSKATLRSELDDIPGIGATRRQRLLKQFGSVRAIRRATVDELARAPGMTRKAAEQVTGYFAGRAASSPASDGDDTAAIAGEATEAELDPGAEPFPDEVIDDDAAPGAP
ncbi:MAG: excinuclease ABC subunit UvrC [Deltaproteobacteria bacterium]|nr:MAG: excinuclease ABC subunit UvrC [Deltaproteobacteria bacterium]TMQ27999.1 MAG: excinuclease ABC subunit UvrC [Deltaproteobacteria bacterium]